MTDPLLEEVRQLRDEYARKFKYDLDAIVRDLQQRQVTGGRKAVKRSPKPAHKLEPVER